MRVILATNNQNKLSEIREIFNIKSWEFFSLSDLSIVSDPEETGKTFLENATIKAQAAREVALEKGLCDYAVVADDSGLCVDALNGGPGVYSARYAEVNGQKCSYSDNNKKLLLALENVDDNLRNAHFETSTVFISPDGSVVEATGICEGKIGHQEIGTNGFGYDPIFFPNETPGKTMAELSPEEKDAISHRGKAFRALREKLISNA